MTMNVEQWMADRQEHRVTCQGATFMTRVSCWRRQGRWAQSRADFFCDGCARVVIKKTLSAITEAAAARSLDGLVPPRKDTKPKRLTKARFSRSEYMAKTRARLLAGCKSEEELECKHCHRKFGWIRGLPKARCCPDWQFPGRGCYAAWCQGGRK